MAGAYRFVASDAVLEADTAIYSVVDAVEVFGEAEVVELFRQWLREQQHAAEVIDRRSRLKVVPC